MLFDLETVGDPDIADGVGLTTFEDNADVGSDARAATAGAAATDAAESFDTGAAVDAAIGAATAGVTSGDGELAELASVVARASFSLGVREVPSGVSWRLVRHDKSGLFHKPARRRQP